VGIVTSYQIASKCPAWNCKCSYCGKRNATGGKKARRIKRAMTAHFEGRKRRPMVEAALLADSTRSCKCCSEVANRARSSPSPGPQGRPWRAPVFLASRHVERNQPPGSTPAIWLAAPRTQGCNRQAPSGLHQQRKGGVAPGGSNNAPTAPLYRLQS